MRNTIKIKFLKHLRLGVGLERDLQNAVLKIEPVEAVDGGHGLVVVGHGHEPEALALVGLHVADHFDTLHGSERSEQLPQKTLVALGSQIIHEYTPAGVVDGAEAVAA